MNGLDFDGPLSGISPRAETFRAFAVFGLLLAILVGAATDLTRRQLNLQVLRERLDLGKRDAEMIASTVDRVAGAAGEIDFGRVRAAGDLLIDFIHSRIANRVFIDHVEIFDRHGVRHVLVVRERRAGEPLLRAPRGFIPSDWPSVGENVVRAALPGRSGEVHVTVNREPILEELEALQRSLRTKIAAAAVLALGVLVAGFFYVLYLLRKNRLLEQARQSASRASYVGLLASGLAHEIRNPLNAMNMNLQMLEEELHTHPEDLDSEHAELLDSTKSEIKRLERLVNNFLAYARPAPPRVEATDVNQVVSEVTRLLENDFRQSEIALESDLSEPLPSVELDSGQFKQALINLLVNARQVLEPGGTVRVVTRAGSSGEVVVEVVDDGPGIAPDAQSRIFEIFYSSRGGGTGLGLPIARQVVERHGGKIELDSELDRGTTFRIRLPRRQGAGRAEGKT